MRRRLSIVLIGLCLLVLNSGDVFAKSIEERLKAGEIIVTPLQKGNIQGVRTLALIDAELEDVWKVITDFKHFKDFMPLTKESKVLAKKGNILYYQGTIEVFPYTVTYILKHTFNTKNKDEWVDRWEMGKGKYAYEQEGFSFKQNFGSWVFKREGKKTRSIYTVYVEYDILSPVPEAVIKKITNLLLKVSAPGVTKATRKRVEQVKRPK